MTKTIHIRAAMCRLSVILCTLFLLNGFAVQPANGPEHIAFQWSAPVVREDGTPASIADVQNYELVRTSTGGSIPDDEWVILIAPTVTEIDFGPLWQATHSFKIRAVGTDGVASAYSDSITVINR